MSQIWKHRVIKILLEEIHVDDIMQIILGGNLNLITLSDFPL